MRLQTFALVVGALALTACGSTRDLKNMPGYGQRSGERLGGVPLRPIANPSEVAATDIAFARAAREDGQWTAFRRYAADGAVIHGRDGVITADPWLAAQDDPEVPVQWTPTAVWSSCDGSTAVSQGKFVDPEGQWGYYVTAWERQRDGRYRWVYDMAAPDEELTAAENARRESVPTGENVVVIRAIEAIEGRVADCKTSADRTKAPLLIPPEGAKVERGYSQDQTLGWTAMHTEGGFRVFQVSTWKNGQFNQALAFRVGPDGKHIPEQ